MALTSLFGPKGQYCRFGQILTHCGSETRKNDHSKMMIWAVSFAPKESTLDEHGESGRENAQNYENRIKKCTRRTNFACLTFFFLSFFILHFLVCKFFFLFLFYFSAVITLLVFNFCCFFPLVVVCEAMPVLRLTSTYFLIFIYYICARGGALITLAALFLLLLFFANFFLRFRRLSVFKLCCGEGK